MEFKIENSKLHQQIVVLQKEISVLKDENLNLKTQYSELEDKWNQLFIAKKGRNSHNAGRSYEIEILNILNKTTLNGKPFNIQVESEIGKSDNDIKCNYLDIRDLSIEIKKRKAPDWVQCTLQYNQSNKKWTVSRKSRLPSDCISIFEDYINNNVTNEEIFQGDIPPFQLKNIMYDEWVHLKNTNPHFKDQYFTKNVPSNIISKLYSAKNCHYIQISGGFGLYHLESGDILDLGVPPFNIKSKLRLRVKVHEKKKGPNGSAILNAMISFMPVTLNPKLLEHSPYSLDDPLRLPPSLVFHGDKKK